MSDYTRIARVIEYLDTHHLDQPDLATLAAQAGLSPAHFHRLFARWAGVTPKDFLQCLTLAHARQLLQSGTSVLDAAYAAGLSGPGRLHDLCVTLEAASPGELKAGGEGWTLTAGHAETPFGLCLIAEGPRGICHLSFPEGRDRGGGETAIRATWPRATLRWSDVRARRLVAPLFKLRVPGRNGSRGPTLHAYLHGTPFQVRVWRALLAIPPGAVVSYGQIADAIGQSGAARAVGSAVGANQLGCLIPCHRVIRETGLVGGYRWGLTRKQAILAWEQSQAGESATPR